MFGNLLKETGLTFVLRLDFLIIGDSLSANMRAHSLDYGTCPQSASKYAQVYCISLYIHPWNVLYFFVYPYMGPNKDVTVSHPSRELIVTKDDSAGNSRRRRYQVSVLLPNSAPRTPTM